MILPLDILLVIALITGILMGYPVSFTLTGVAGVFAVIGYFTGNFDMSLLGALGQRFFGIMTNDVLIAIPLFVLMGIILEKTKIAEELLETMGKLFGRLPGGLGISVVIVGALLAASTGIVGATVVAMGMIALPTMLRNKYNPCLASGIVCSAGTLGQIIPPSTLLIILTDVMSNSYQQAQFAQGKFNIETLSVGQMFAAALVPGFVLVFIYIVYLLFVAWFFPNQSPSLTEVGDDRPSVKIILKTILPPILLIVAVLGSILGGIATPAEAAAVGAIGALLIAGSRQKGNGRVILIGIGALFLLSILAGLYPVRFQRSNLSPLDIAIGVFCIFLALIGAYTVFRSLMVIIKQKVMAPVLNSTMVVTSMIFATILTASMFSLVFIGLGGKERIVQVITAMPGGATGALLFCMALIFVLGFFLDFVEISVILLPLICPPLIMMGHDPIWLSVVIAFGLMSSFLTPPFGFSLFYLRGAAPPEISTGQIYKGVMPFIALQILCVLVLWFFPKFATFLPNLLF